MNHWPFILAAYALTIAGTVGLALWSFAAMRRAEARADALTRPRGDARADAAADAAAAGRAPVRG